MPNEGRICPQCAYERQPKDLAPDYECPRCGIIYDKYRPPEPKPSPEPAVAAKVCPQCSYERQPKDLAPDYECPRCGIIYAKYRPPEPKPSPAESLTDTEMPEEDAEWKLRPASPLRRALAGIYTFSLVILCFVPVKLVVDVAFRITHSPNSINSGTIVGTIRNWETVCYIFLALLVIYAFFYRPLVDGATWGQEKFGLAIRPRDDPEGSLSLKGYFLRFLGNLVALGAWPVTIGGLLYDLAAKRNDRGIADRFSSTQQYETEAALPFRANFGKACFPLCIALILQFAVVGPLSLLLMKGYYDRASRSLRQQIDNFQPDLPPPRQGMQAPPDAQATSRPAAQTGMAERLQGQAIRQSSIGILSVMEKQHLYERGSYTEDLEALVASYGSNSREGNELMRLVLQSAVRARKTAKGIELWVEMAPGEWKSKELLQ